MTPKFATPPELISSGSGFRYEATPAQVVPFPLVLQSRAMRTLRHHVMRGLIRGAILLAADILVLTWLRALKKGLRDVEWLGPSVAEVARDLVPPGSYPAPQLHVAVIFALIVFGNYGQGDHRRDPGRIVLASLLGFGLMFWGRLWSDFTTASLIGFVLTVGSCAGALVMGRTLIDVVTRYLRPDRHTARTLVIGCTDSSRQTLRYRPFRRRADFHMVGYLTTDTTLPSDALGSVDDLVGVLERHRVDTVILSGAVSDDVFSAVVDAAASAGCQVFSLPRYFHGRYLDPQLVWRRGVPLIQLSRPGMRGQHLVLKRALDLVGAVAGLVVLAPLFAVIAVLVTLSSPGPVFFRQERVGQRGHRFRIYKFRSMVVDAEARRDALATKSVYTDGRLFKIPDDPRITPIGAFLRRTSLDELPQLWNVLRGEMSLVGPRPPLPSEVALYEEHHYARFEMKPGITGPWQVNGRNAITDFEAVIRLEAAYMRQWSIWRDLGILWRTIPVVMRMEGAH